MYLNNHEMHASLLQKLQDTEEAIQRNHNMIVVT